MKPHPTVFMFTGHGEKPGGHSEAADDPNLQKNTVTLFRCMLLKEVWIRNVEMERTYKSRKGIECVSSQHMECNITIQLHFFSNCDSTVNNSTVTTVHGLVLLPSVSRTSGWRVFGTESEWVKVFGTSVAHAHRRHTSLYPVLRGRQWLEIGLRSLVDDVSKTFEGLNQLIGSCRPS